SRSSPSRQSPSSLEDLSRTHPFPGCPEKNLHPLRRRLHRTLLPSAAPDAAGLYPSPAPLLPPPSFRPRHRCADVRAAAHRDPSAGLRRAAATLGAVLLIVAWSRQGHFPPPALARSRPWIWASMRQRRPWAQLPPARGCRPGRRPSAVCCCVPARDPVLDLDRRPAVDAQSGVTRTTDLGGGCSRDFSVGEHSTWNVALCC
ncbi:unnamed protein product, partial [Urochloa humidicola]